MKFRKFLILSSLLIIAFFISSCNSNDEWVDWTKDMYKIGDTVGSYETSDMQVIIRDATIKRVDGVNKLVLSIRMANNTPYYIQLYDGNFNVYDYTLGKNSYPLQVYGMNAGYSYFPLGDQYSRLPEIGQYGLNQVDFYIAYNITDSTDINNLYIAVNLGDIDLGHIQFYSIYLGGGISNNEDSDVVVSFVTNSEETLTSKTVQFEGQYGSLPTVEKIGYEFEGWYLSNDFIGQKVEANKDVTIQSDHNLYAKWLVIDYDVRLKYNDNTTPDSVIQVNYGLPYNLNAPVRNGYVFSGWYLSSDYSGDKINSDDLVFLSEYHELFAKWDITTYSLNYENVYGTNNNPNSFTILDSSILLEPLSRIGYTFEGWFDTSIFSNKYTMIEQGSYGNMTLYAKWKANDYDVTLDYSYDDRDSGIYVATFDLTYDLPIPARDGYIFEGWYLDETGYDNEVTSSTYVTTASDHTLYARWVIGTEGLELELGIEYYVGNQIYLLEDEYTVVDFDRSSNDVVIPSTYKGLPVTSIGFQAFSGFSSMTSIVIPEGIIAIGYRAFENCSGLTSLILPYSATIFLDNMGNKDNDNYYNQMCYGCDNLEVIAVPIIEKTNSYDDPLYGYFGPWTEETANVPSTLKVVIVLSQENMDYFDFSDYSIEAIVLPNTLKSILLSYVQGLELYITHTSKPSSWSSDWAGDNIVHWGGTWSYVDGIPTPNEHEVTLIHNDTLTAPIQMKVISGRNYDNLPVPTRDGYIFEGWYLDETGYDNEVTSSTYVTTASDHTLYARWVIGTEGLELELGIEYYVGNQIYLLEDEYTVVDFDRSSNDVVIPSTYKGLPVTSIGFQAFSGFSSMTSIVIPEGIIAIGYRAFENCSGLTSLILPYSATIFLDNMGNKDNDNYYNQMCYGCDNLEVIAVPIIEKTNSYDDPLYGYFGPWTEETANVPSTLKVVIVLSQEYMKYFDFSDYSIEAIVLPNTLKSINLLYVEGLVLYTTHTSKPSSWSSDWAGDNIVHWGGTWSYVDGIPTPKT
jgi:uncharacterized repeat protein (TIGR02543 family)